MHALKLANPVLFLSTLSLRRATKPAFAGYLRSSISIHALLAESDTIMDNIIFVPGKFLSTLSLRRATINKNLASSVKDLFLSTLSLRRATTGLGVGLYLVTISIHALLAESDRLRYCIY